MNDEGLDFDRARNARRRVLLAGALALAFAATSLGWAATSGAFILTISVPAGGTTSGRVADVTPMGDTFTVTQGAANVVSGLELFRINLSSARLSDQVRVHVLLLNPLSVGQTIGNPNAFIEVAVWYPNATGEHTLSTGTSVSKDADAEDRLVSSRGELVLKPTIPNQTTLYVLARIVVPGHAPPGAQGQLTSLQFHADVRV